MAKQSISDFLKSGGGATTAAPPQTKKKTISEFLTGGQGSRPQSSSGGASPSTSALPPKKPTAAPPAYQMFVDPSRNPTSELGKKELPQSVVAGLSAGLKMRNLDKLFIVKPTDKVQLGDILPGVQEALKPIFRPGQTQKEYDAEHGKQEEVGKRIQEHNQMLANMKQANLPFPQAVGAYAGYIGEGIDIAGQASSEWLKKNLGQFGGGVAGTPQALMNVFNLPAQVTEQVAGAVEQGVGVGVNPAQAIISGQAIPTLSVAGAAIARAVGADDIADELEKHTEAPPGVLANLLANVIARQRAAGQDTAQTEGLLNAALQAQSLITKAPDAESVIARQEELIKMASAGLTPESWKAATYAYEGTEYMKEAADRLENGEDWDTVRQDIESRVSGEARVYDFVGQMVLDPTNVLDKIGGIPALLGKKSRGQRNAAEAISEFVLKTDEGAGLVRLAEQAGDVTRVGQLEMALRNGPLGFLVKPLPETIAARRAEETSSVIKMITQGISPEAPSRLLEAGIDQHPVALAIEAFINHNADDLAGTGKSSSQIQDLLGLGGRVISPAEAKTLGSAPDAMIDMFRSNAADRAREWFVKAADGGVEKLAREFVDMQKLYSSTLLERTVTIADEAGDIVLEGQKAVDYAENKLIKWLEGVQDAYKTAAGVAEPEGLYKNVLTTRKWFAKAQGPFRFFHMGTNPGMAIRNMGNNKMIGWLDGFNMLTPIKSTQAEIGRLGFSGGGLARSLGAQSDVTKKLRGGGGGIKGFLNKIDPMQWSQRFESEASQQIYLQAAQRQLSENWRVGKAIPEQQWAEVSRKLGDRADEAKALIEGSWAPGELQSVVSRLQSGEPWKATAATVLADTHDTVLRADLDEIISGASSRETAADLIEEYVGKARDQFQQILDNGMVMEGTPAAHALEAAQVATKGLPPKQRGKFLDDFSKQLIKQDATVYLHESYMNNAVKQLEGIDDGILKAAGINPPFGATFSEYVAKRQLAIERMGKETMSNFRPTQYEIFDAIKEQDWNRVKEVGQRWADANGVPNPFAGSSNKQRAWDDYFSWSDQFWSDYRANHVTEMEGLYKEAADAIEAAGKPRPPAVPDNLIDKFLPLPSYEQRRLFAQIQAIGRSRGINTTVELRDILQKYNVQHANRLFRADIVDKNWYENAVSAIMKWSQEEGAAAKLSGEVDDAEELATLLSKFDLDDIDPHSMNVIEGKAAQMSERDSQIQNVLDGLRNNDSQSIVDDDGIQALKDLIKELEPRHTATRAIAEQVATKSRDFALLNYSDSRGIDLMAGMMYNYPKWYMGSMKNMVSRALENPGRMATLLKFRQQIRNVNRDLPEWWQDQISIKTAAGPLYFNILASIDPLNGFLGDKFRDPDLYNDPLSAFMAETQQFGPGLHGIWATTMAIRASLQGDKEASMGWVGNLGPATRGVTALTALAKEYGGPGLDFIPSGGVVLEPWLWRLEEGQGAQMIGSKYDARRIGLSLSEMVQMGLDGDPNGITAEEAYDAMLSQRGEIFDRALQMSKEHSATSVLMSWLAGAGVKPRPDIEIDVQRMDADRIALMQAKSDGYYDGRPEAWRKAWEEMRDNYPWMDFVQGFRRDETGRANIYAMSVYDRLPPNPRPYFKALGLDEDVYSDLLDDFYGYGANQKPCSIENMPEASQDLFMGMMKLMGAVLSLPSDATGNEWNMARQARTAMYDQLNMQYAGATDLQDRYFDILNSGEPDAYQEAKTYLDTHGQLQSYWDDKDKLIAADPILKKYWGSMELFERVSKDQFEASMEKEYPGLHDQLNEYYRRKDIDPADAKKYLAEHPSLKVYWSAKDDWTVGLGNELTMMSQGISNLEGEWGAVRGEASPEMLGQQRVIDLIQSGSRPMGDFVLPEDMDARQVQAQIQSELNNVTNWGALYKQLKTMGNLDDTLAAFQEWGHGSSGIPTIQANMTELKALLTAISAINEGTATDVGGGGGGGSSRTKVRSNKYGGASTAPKKQQAAQTSQQSEQVAIFMGSLVEQAPTYFGLLRNMSGMTQSEIAALLESNPNFRAWLTSVSSAYGLQSLLDYFKRPTSTTKKSTKKSSASKVTRIVSSQPGL